MVVDFPAPLLPRKPKISPRATSKLTRSTATNWPKRRVRSRTTIDVLFAAGGEDAGLSAKRPLQPRFGETDAGDRARAIELRLEPRDLRVEHFGVERDPLAVALVDDALGLG